MRVGKQAERGEVRPVVPAGDPREGDAGRVPGVLVKFAAIQRNMPARLLGLFDQVTAVIADRCVEVSAAAAPKQVNLGSEHIVAELLRGDVVFGVSVVGVG